MSRVFSVSVFCRFELKVLLVRPSGSDIWRAPEVNLDPEETPLEAADRCVFEYTRLHGNFRPIRKAPRGTPAGFFAYEEEMLQGEPALRFCFTASLRTNELTALPDQEYSWIDPISVQVRQHTELPVRLKDLLWEVGKAQYQ